MIPSEGQHPDERKVTTRIPTAITYYTQEEATYMFSKSKGLDGEAASLIGHSTKPSVRP
jgi:hypothetical protein